MALMEIIRRNHNPAHADTQVPPTVMVTITLDELLKRSGHGDLIGTREHVSSETVRRLCCDANIIRIVTDGDSENPRPRPHHPHRTPQIPAGPGGPGPWLCVPRLRPTPRALPSPPHQMVGPRQW